jgi:ADP-heptose:LPS heptosyltransferase
MTFRRLISNSAVWFAAAPAATIIRAFSLPPCPSSHRPRILVLRLDEIGDLILTGPFLRELRRNRPNAHITIVVKPKLEPLLEHCPYIDQILSWKAPETRNPRAASIIERNIAALRFTREHLLPNGPIESAFIPRPSSDFHHAIALSFISGAKNRHAFITAREANYHRNDETGNFDSLLTHALHPPELQHEVQRSLALLENAGMTVVDDSLEAWIAPEVDTFVSAFTNSNAPLLVVHPSASALKRVWPMERYTEVIAHLVSAYGFMPVFVGSLFEGSNILHKTFPNAINLIGKTTLQQLWGVVRSSALFLGADSGPMHMAAAAGIPSIVISCHPASGDPNHPNSMIRFGPWKTTAAIIQPRSALSPCSAGCEATEPHCILQISTEEVIEQSNIFCTKLSHGRT